MKKIRLWSFMCIFVLCVSMFSGCGGGSSSDSGGSNPLPTPTPSPEPNNEPDTYDISKVLTGTWYGISGSGTATGPDGTYDLTMRTLRARFSEIQVTGDTGTAKLTGFQVWNANTRSGVYTRTVRLESNSDEMTLIHVGSDTWRCEYLNGTVLTLKMETEKTGQATQEGIVDIGGYVYNYTATIEVRK